MPMLTWLAGTMGGSETYALEVLKHLQQRDDLDVRALVNTEADLGLVGDAIVDQTVHLAPSTTGRVRAQVQAARSVKARRAVSSSDIVHYPFTVTSPAPRGTPHVLTLHDVLHRDRPDAVTRAERLYRAVRYDRPAQSADAVLTVSHFCKDRIVHRLGIPPHRVHVAHLGVETRDFSPRPDPPDPFVLFPARGWPHKNHARLIKAMAEVRRSMPDLELVLTGGGLNHLRQLPPWVSVRGLVTREDLLDLYRRAACLAFPSTYEGFGLPPLEAMASGCPVAVAQAGSLPEVCGNAAVYFDPTNTTDMARGIREAVLRRDELVPLGLSRAQGFTWKRCADVHGSVYASVLRARSRLAT